VSDGDTITVLDRARATHKVRLNGIDAPEKKQAYGGEARRHLADLVFGKPVVVSWHKRDRYGRLVGRVGLAAAACGQADCPRVEDVGLAQVESGLAWHYRQYRNEQSAEERSRYALAEHEARSRRKGLWRDAQPVPPWEYRNGHRAAAAAFTVTR
jgi:endonuclease YncB( thermonuclease family)